VLAADFDTVARQCGDALDQAGAVFRREEGDDVAALRFAEVADGDVGQRHFQVVGDAVDEDHVAFQQVGMHGGGRYRIPVGDGGAEYAQG